VVIDNFDFIRVTLTPGETYSPLIVDPNAPLPGPIPSKFLEPVRRRNGKVFESRRSIEHAQLSESDALQIRRQPPRALQVEELLGFAIRPTAYHRL
jgi:hypothetical protein